MDLEKDFIKKDDVTKGLNNSDELANLKNINELDNNVTFVDGDLIVCTANDSHVKEIAELWANLACIQQMYAPERYNFLPEGKDWQAVVRRKMEKTHNLLLVAHNKNSAEIKGFLYLQSITIPSSNLVLKGVIEDIYTKPQYRRQDIASALLNVGIFWALKQKIKQIDLISLTRSNDLIQFYLRFLKESKQDISLDLVTV
jgi:GNAT superfamily N-acetyltransferase